MKSYWNILLSVCLSVLIIVTGSPFQLMFKAQAQESTRDAQADQAAQKAAEEEALAQKAMEEGIAKLREAFIDPSKGEAELDPFLLTRQRVIDERQANVDAVVEEERRIDYFERIAYIESEIEQLNELEKLVDRKLESHGFIENETDRKAVEELSLVKDDISSRRKLLELDLQDTLKFDPRITGKALSEGEIAQIAKFDPARAEELRDMNSIKVELMVDTDIPTRHYWGRRMQILVGDPTNPDAVVKQREFTESLKPGFAKGNPLAGVSNESGFVIADNRGRLLHEFFKPVEAVFFFGQYLVYVESEAVEKAAEGQLPVRFVDLRYFRANVGNGPLPVFTLPINTTEVPNEFKIENGRLHIGNTELSYAQVDVMAKAQQVIFNVNVALVDPASYKNAQPLIQEIIEYFGKSMESQGQVFQNKLESSLKASGFIDQMTADLKGRPAIDVGGSKFLIEKALADGKISGPEYDQIRMALDASSGVAEANEAVRSGRGLFTRMALLGKYLVEPRPEGAPKLFNSLVILAAGSKEDKQRVIEMGKDSFAWKMTKYGAAAGGALLAASQLPEPYTIDLYKGMDLVSATFQHFMGYLEHINYGKAYAELSVDATITSTTGWTYILDAYILDGRWVKFLYGLTSVLIIPAKVFASIHIVVNSWKMLGKSVQVRRLSGQEKGFISSFVEAADRDNKAYWDSITESEKRVSGSDASQVTEEEFKLLEEHIERLKRGREGVNAVERDIRRNTFNTLSPYNSAKRRIGSGFTYSKNGLVRAGQYVVWNPATKFMATYTLEVGGFLIKNRVSRAIGQRFLAVSKKLNLNDIEKVPEALKQSFLSYSALRSTFKMNALIWNFLFVVRSFAWTPSKWMMALIYPNYFRVTMHTTKGKQHLPTHYNGGLELWPRTFKTMMSVVAEHVGVDRLPLIRNMLVSHETLEALREFEKAVHPMEDIAKEVALKKAQIALMENIKDPARIAKIFDSGETSQRMGATTGIRSLHDPKIKELTTKEKLFYRAYFTRTFDLMMQQFIMELGSPEVAGEMDARTFARNIREQVRQGKDIGIRATPEQILDTEHKIEQILDFEAIRSWANQVGNNGRNIVAKMDIQFRHKLLEKGLYPSNPQMHRYLTVREKVEDPRAMERAMRMEVATLLAGIPNGIMATLALYAGVETGLLQPFDPEGMNTETHFRYMSRYLFYNGFVPGLILGMLANTWMKVQEDAFTEEKGGFDRVIRHSDGVRGFWRNYFKQSLKNPANKWADRQKQYLSMIYANIPAAAITVIVFNLYGLGRVDVGAFMAGYVLIFTLPIIGFNFKFEQGFELASAWFANKVPRRLRAHKEAQRYINASIQKQKIVIGYVDSLIDIVIMENLMGKMVTLKDNAKYGTRAFFRLMFGGETPTNILNNFVDKLVDAFHNVPGVENALEAVRKLFTNNYEAFERFPDRLPLPPEGVQRVVENPNLPKNALGEVIGKSAGLATTFGALTAIPYKGTGYLNKRNQAKIQARGRGLRCVHLFRAH